MTDSLSISPQISFLSFTGCPLAPQARSNLVDAINTLDSDLNIDFEEVDLLSDSTPNEVKRWGSPTILINGADLMGFSKGDACGCRIYNSDGGVPTISEIVDAVKKAGES